MVGSFGIGSAALTAALRETISNDTMIKRVITSGFGLLAAFLFASSARGQGGTALTFAPGVHSGPVALHPGAGHPGVGGRTGGVANFGHGRRFGGRRRAFVGGYGYDPYYYSDSETEDAEAPPPQVVFVPPAPAVPPATPAKPAESLLLERHGDTWMRISASGDAHAVSGDRFDRSTMPASGASTNSVKGAAGSSGAGAVVEIPPAVLVFRDGHTEEIRKYVISGTTLFTSGDYWSTGSWTRKISIADLNVRETLRRNQERGAGFSLPSRAGEVMMRP